MINIAFDTNAIILDATLLTDDKQLLDLSWPGLKVQHILSQEEEESPNVTE